MTARLSKVPRFLSYSGSPKATMLWITRPGSAAAANFCSQMPAAILLRLTPSFDARNAAERPQREKRELKVLDGKWDSDNRHRQCDRQTDVAEKDP